MEKPEKKGLVVDCCHLIDESKGSCQRVEDGKVFTLPRRFSRQNVIRVSRVLL